MLPGEYVALPIGESGAQQITTTSEEPLRYLYFSTTIEPAVMVYPDSDKIGLFPGSAPGGPKDKRILSKLSRSDA